VLPLHFRSKISGSTLHPLPTARRKKFENLRLVFGGGLGRLQGLDPAKKNGPPVAPFGHRQTSSPQPKSSHDKPRQIQAKPLNGIGHGDR